MNENCPFFSLFYPVLVKKRFLPLFGQDILGFDMPRRFAFLIFRGNSQKTVKSAIRE
ncbi:hypothetical protein [Candidatus Hecatella orcuttiae]|uniref:hypothetical protein n=1 Tax=Candidatus Hecatella orcuttiae TaxID=1935119 RepID=UPI002867C778|nr:hypothetical protein [Candidatus Hecatella orcuttiae]